MVKIAASPGLDWDSSRHLVRPRWAVRSVRTSWQAYPLPDLDTQGVEVPGINWSHTAGLSSDELGFLS